jgi:hypothetical protein
MTSHLTFLVHQLRLNNLLLGQSLRGLDDADIRKPPIKNSNSMLWLLGHLISSRYNMLSISGSELSNPLGEKFNRGAELTDADSYPDTKELKQLFSTVGATIEEHFELLTEDELAADCPIDRYPVPDKSVFGGLNFLTWHEGYHIGQLAFLHKIISGKQLVG